MYNCILDSIKSSNEISTLLSHAYGVVDVNMWNTLVSVCFVVGECF